MPTKVFAFNDYVKGVDLDPNQRYLAARGSKTYEKAFLANDAIEARCQQIEQQAWASTAEETKYNALNALCDISHAVLEAEGSTLAREVRKHFGGNDRLEECMLSVLQSVSEDDFQAFADMIYAPYEGSIDGLWDQLHVLNGEADDYACFPRLAEVIDAIGAEDSDAEESDAEDGDAGGSDEEGDASGDGEDDE